MADFQRQVNEFKSEGINILAGSVDTLQDTRKLINELGLSFPVAYELELRATLNSVGGFYDHEKQFFQPSGFLLRPEGIVEVSVYSSGPIGRLNADDVLTLVRHYKQNRN